MSQEIRRSCIDCAVTRCDNHTSTRPHPAFCVSQQVTEEQRGGLPEPVSHRPGGPKAGPGGRGH